MRENSRGRLSGREGSRLRRDRVSLLLMKVLGMDDDGEDFISLIVLVLPLIKYCTVIIQSSATSFESVCQSVNRSHSIALAE